MSRPGQFEGPRALSQRHTIFLFTALTVSGLVSLVPQLGISGWLLLASGFTVAGLLPKDSGSSRRPLPKFAWSNVAIGSLGVVPVFAVLYTTWNQEFPFIGDHDFHLSQAAQSFFYWRSYFIPAIVLLVSVYIASRRIAPITLALISACIIVAAGIATAESLPFGIRYPGAFQFILYPMSNIAHLFHWESPLNALRVANALSVPVWLFGLRPYFLRRWPDLPLLPLIVGCFLQKDTVYYFTSAYLEPWAIVLAIVGCELLLIQTTSHKWMSLLLIGLAAMCKEQSILLLPFAAAVLFVNAPTKLDKARVTASAFITAVPFGLYYGIRNHNKIWRTVQFTLDPEHFSVERLNTFIERVLLQFGVGTLYVFAAVIVGIYFVWRNRDFLGASSLLIVASLFQIGFFFCDSVSMPWTGYPRFHIFSLFILYLVFGYALIKLSGRRTTISMGLVAVAGGVLNLYSFVPFFQTTLGPDIKRNFFEHTDSPVYFPIRSLLTKAAARGELSQRKLVIFDPISHISPPSHMGIFPNAYPGIVSLFESLEVVKAEKHHCECKAANTAYLAPFIFFTGLSESHGDRVTIERAQRSCLSSLRQTCRFIEVISEKEAPVVALASDPQS